VWYGAVYAFRYFGRSRTVTVSENKQVTFTYEKIDIPSESDHDARIFEYINKHYFMPELSIADVQEHTGLSERKISNIIKEQTDLGFKQYVNSIRLSEAKRLLKESDLQVSEIAYRIGYNNVTHFNRVFKLAEGIAPTNYREQFIS
jgi:AraC-like DNA-binding protein